jgi:GNAT superfamily N-acetyltransferase
MKSEFQIRTAVAADIAVLTDLIEQSVRKLSRDDYSPEQMDAAIGNVLGLDTQLIKDRTYFVACPAEQPEMIAGCGGWSYRKTLCGSDQAPNREMTALDPQHDAAKIRAIFVHPAWARRGLGTRMLKYCEEAAMQAGFHRFEMGSTLTGVPLYALRGYQACERIEISLPNGSTLPVLRMVKSISTAHAI